MFSRPIAAAAAVIVIASALAACGGSDDKPTGSSGSTGSGAAAAPTKSPLDVFFINEQGSTTGASYPQETAAAKATVEYINTKLGGVDGHPIKLATCFTDTTPASTTTCANKAVSANPIVITAGTLATDNDIIAVTGKTDIPYVSNAGYTADTLTAKGKAFIVSNYADAIDTAFPILMKRNGVKKVAEIYVNVPAVVNGLLPLTKKAFDAQGIAYDLYPVPYPSSDLTPTISAIARTDADAIQFQTDPVTCGAALNAIKTFQFTKPLYGGSACRTAANNAIV
jgi:branched-chain amino acid transport system substrate-binding protein